MLSIERTSGWVDRRRRRRRRQVSFALYQERRGHGVSPGRVLRQSSNGLLAGGVRIRNRGGRLVRGQEGGLVTSPCSVRASMSFTTTTVNHNWPVTNLSGYPATDEWFINQIARLGSARLGPAQLRSAPLSPPWLRSREGASRTV